MGAPGEIHTGQRLSLRLNADGRGPITQVMHATRPRLLAPALFALAATTLVAWVSLAYPGFSDFDNEAAPAYAALRGGDLAGFFSQLPAYGGSLVLRAPSLVLTDLLGGGADGALRATALPCLLAAAVFGVVLFGVQDRGPAAWLTLAVATLNPLTVRALDVGHPEELLGAVLCAGAVLAAMRDRPVAAGVLLGLAIGNKAWALLAIGPVALALSRGLGRAALAAGVATALVWGPVILATTTAAHPAPVTGAIFQPWQIWWFLGEHGHEVRGLAGQIKEGYRAAPGWLSPLPHPLIIVVGAAASLAAAFVRGRTPRDGLLLLGLLLFMRGWLDPWNTAYYALPAAMALLAWEATGRRMPAATIAFTALTWATTVLLTGRVSPDLQAAWYLAWALPFTAVLTLRVFAPAAARAQLTKVKLFGSPLSTSAPVSVTATRSSIRTPTAPGR